jgi:hypothetical protein
MFWETRKIPADGGFRIDYDRGYFDVVLGEVEVPTQLAVPHVHSRNYWRRDTGQSYRL